MHDNFDVHRKVREQGKATETTVKPWSTKQEIHTHHWHWGKQGGLENIFRESIPWCSGRTRSNCRREAGSSDRRGESRQAAGQDQIQTEFLLTFQMADENTYISTEDKIKWLTRIVNIYSTEEIPADWLKSDFMTLPQKTSAKTGGNFRMSLINHFLKLFLKIIHKIIYRLCEEQISSSQFGFVTAVGTRKALFGV